MSPRPRMYGESYGCQCGSVAIIASDDPRETERIARDWRALHPEGRSLNGAVHERVTVERARELRKARGQEVERSRVEFH